MQSLNEYTHMCTWKYTIFRKQTHDFFHAYNLMMSKGPLKLPGCLSSAWPLKRRLRLRLRRWGFFSLSSAIAKFIMNYSDKKKTNNKKKNKNASFLPRFNDEARNLIEHQNIKMTCYWQVYFCSFRDLK